MSLNKKSQTYLIVLVAALGYFVDIYDLVLFSVERRDSLLEILGPNATDLQLKNVGMNLLNWQMGGMLVGGLLWGIIGDKKGRLSVLFGSILLYSLANIINGFVQTVPQYALLRFISGFGLAGELGAGITLVSETMSKEKRGYGTMIVATVGVFGAVVAGFMGDVITNWRYSYFLGGAMGLVLLLMRMGILESGMFKTVKESKAKRGNFFMLFQNKKTAIKYLSIIAIAVPVWYVMGILITFAPEITPKLGLLEKPDGGKSIMFAYIGITIGDLVSGLMSQLMKSRKKVLFIFLLLTLVGIIMYFTVPLTSLFMFYTIITFIGFATGYWAVFMGTASELFGTNIRATATTTAPNFVRGAVIPLSLSFRFIEGYTDTISAAIWVGIIVLVIGFIAVYLLEETYHKDLDYTE
ncbi:MAG: MFS transporter [Bacteroidota bacterium]